MISAVDTNVISVIWTNEANARTAEQLLSDAYAQGRIILCPIVYAELLAHPAIPPATAEALLLDADVQIDFELDQPIWREAGIRYRAYAQRRRRSRQMGHRRLMADFIIGAHALARASRLITFNEADYRRDFPELKVLP